MYYLLSPKVINTNPLCLVRSEIINNRNEPTVEVSLGKIVISKGTIPADALIFRYLHFYKLLTSRLINYIHIN